MARSPGSPNTSSHNGALVLPHTVVPPAFEGKGVASALATAALGYAREHGLKVKPICPFMAGYIKKHPEWQDLVHPDFRARLGAQRLERGFHPVQRRLAAQDRLDLGGVLAAAAFVQDQRAAKTFPGAPCRSWRWRGPARAWPAWSAEGAGPAAPGRSPP